MSAAGLLDKLAAQAGIAPHYHDAWGAYRTLSVDTKRAFLAAMGLPATTEEEAALSLASLTTRSWRRALEPVAILHEGRKEWVVGIVVEAEAAGTAAWRITTEDGGQLQGDVVLGELPVRETTHVDGRHLERRLFELPKAPGPGYHRLDVTGSGLPGGAGTATLIVAPEHAHLPDQLQVGPGIWGFGLQLYGLQGRSSWGMGDFGDLSGFAAASADLGASALGLNPLHALFPGNPAHASPYSPSSRCFVNPLYLEIEAVPDIDACADLRDKLVDPSFRSALAGLRHEPLVDYPKVAAAKLPVLERLFSAFSTNHLQRGTARAEAFHQFQRDGGAALERHATFEALAEHLRGGETGHFPWHRWPAPYRDPTSPETLAFARNHADRVAFHQYLQWEADRQLASAAAACTRGGMAIGLYRDLAVGVDADGADAWAEQDLLARDISTGAPPDPFNLQGQSWGFPPFNPHALRDAAYRPFIDCLRANMRHAGALRIDHIMGLARLFWIPRHASALEGGYVRYPLDDLLAITALESQRARCVIVGEDLGTVPEGLRERLVARRILSTRLLYFERDADGSFRPAQAYPSLAQVATGTHDLPTFPGYWRERDIALRAALHLLPAHDSEASLRQDRANARTALLKLLRDAGTPSPTDVAADLSDVDLHDLVKAAYRFLATSPARLLIAQLEDVLGIEEQVNMPGTVETHPNWRRKLPEPWEELVASARLRDVTELLTRLRPRQS